MTDESTRDSAAGAAVYLVVPASLDQLAEIRRQLRNTVVAAGTDRTVADDVALAASELSTNVIQYVATEEFSVSCVRTDANWVLEVSHADGVDLARRADVVPSAQGGRGLMVVRALMDSVELVDRPTGTSIRCTVAAN